jgi:hypothetical protein
LGKTAEEFIEVLLNKGRVGQCPVQHGFSKATDSGFPAAVDR